MTRFWTLSFFCPITYILIFLQIVIWIHDIYDRYKSYDVFTHRSSGEGANEEGV